MCVFALYYVCRRHVLTLADEPEVTSSSQECKTKFYLFQPSEGCSQSVPGEEGRARLHLLRRPACVLGPPDANSTGARLSY